LLDVWLENGSQQVEDLGNHDDWENMHDLAVVLLNHQETVGTLGQVLGAVLLGPGAVVKEVSHPEVGNWEKK
jgi:hypothetical protein